MVRMIFHESQTRKPDISMQEFSEEELNSFENKNLSKDIKLKLIENLKSTQNRRIKNLIQLILFNQDVRDLNFMDIMYSFESANNSQISKLEAKELDLNSAAETFILLRNEYLALDVEDDLKLEFYSIINRKFDTFIKKVILNYKRDFRSLISKEQQGAGQVWESFLNLMCVVYSNSPDSGLEYWIDMELSKFLRVAADVYDAKYLALFLKLLRALSSGTESSQHCNMVMNSGIGNLSWATFFRTLQLYLERFMTGNMLEISVEETILICAFLGLVENVCNHAF